MCTSVQIQIILNTINKLAQETFYGDLDAVILYGSYARGDYDENSDIDVMVRVRMPKIELMNYRRLFSCLGSRLGLEYNIVVSIHLQDFETFNHYREVHAFFQNIEKEGVVVGA